MVDLLFVLSERETFNKYSKFIKPNILTKETNQIFKDLKQYYNDFPSTDTVDWYSFATWFRVTKHPTFNEDKHDIFLRIFETLADCDPDEEHIESLVETFVKRDYATRIYGAAQDVAEGTSADLDKVNSLMDEYNDTLGNVKDITTHEAVWDMDTIMDNTVGGTGLTWRMDCMNESIGSIRKGNFLIVGARPDTGKTTFLASEATYMAQQLEDDEHVIWFNNEEAGSAVQSRIMQAALGCTGRELDIDREQSFKDYCAVMGRPDKIKVIDKAVITVQDVHQALKSYKVGLIVFDQLWKVQGVSDASNDVHRMTLLFSYAREWAKEYAPVITVHQADGSAEGIEYLTMNQLYMSKTGVQGEADAIIMIGRSNDPIKKDSRFISIPKNKLPAGTKPSERNMKREVIMDAEHARFKEGV